MSLWQLHHSAVFHCHHGFLQMGEVSVGRIYSEKYLRSSPAWAKTKLNDDGFQMLCFDQDLPLNISKTRREFKEVKYKVKWMGQLPWLSDLMVGLELVSIANFSLLKALHASNVSFRMMNLLKRARTVSKKTKTVAKRARTKNHQLFMILVIWNIFRFCSATPTRHWCFLLGKYQVSCA